MLILLLGFIDYLTGYEVAISLFYLIPISFVAWYAGTHLGLITSALAALSLVIADYFSGLIYSNLSIYVWNALIWVGFFFIVAWLMSSLRRSYLVNQDLARVDYVTGAVSIRFFYELARIEIERSARYKRPFSLAYFDMDNFKAINDRLGHSVGDQVLRSVADNVHRLIRKSDTFARLGGDEFALLLPETNSGEARKLIERVHDALISAMLNNNWAVTFSVGVVTFNQPPESVDELVKLADEVMYSIKTTTKDGVAYSVH